MCSLFLLIYFTILAFAVPDATITGKDIPGSICKIDITMKDGTHGLCSGVLIGKTTIHSAGHCLKKDSVLMVASCKNGRNIQKIVKSTLHNSYISPTRIGHAGQNNDFVLFEVSEPVDTTPMLVALDSASFLKSFNPADFLSGRVKCIAFGFGGEDDGKGGEGAQLRPFITVPQCTNNLVKLKMCDPNSSMPNGRYNLSAYAFSLNQMLSYGGIESGDSGGPVVCYDPSIDQYVLVAINSFGAFGGVMAYSELIQPDWIATNIAPSERNLQSGMRTVYRTANALSFFNGKVERLGRQDIDSSFTSASPLVKFNDAVLSKRKRNGVVKKLPGI